MDTTSDTYTMMSLRSLWSHVSLLALCLAHLACAAPCEKGVPSLTLPTSDLPLPQANLTLKYIAIGVGTQNYTCAGSGATPFSVGAKAKLLDATYITSQAVLDNATLAAFTGNTKHLKKLGDHFFTADIIPVFDLTAVHKIFFGKKIEAVDAPSDANAGPANTGAVPWLLLGDKGGSIGVEEVYRIKTAGGKAPASCDSQDSIQIPYTAQYWFFG